MPLPVDAERYGRHRRLFAVLVAVFVSAVLSTACAGESASSGSDDTALPLSVRDTERQGADARELLTSLTVVDALEAPVPYDRDDYDGWVDADGDCLNTRHEVLAAESVAAVTIENCRVVAGAWIDWLTGDPIDSPADATIDHVVALGHAHRAGAWAWSPETKTAFANDLDEASTLNIASPASNQAKADASPDQWRPTSEAAWCGYAISWIRIKARWSLAATPGEVDALAAMLDTCTAPIAIGLGADFATTPIGTATIVLAEPTPSPPPPTPIELSAKATLTVVDCDARAEIVSIANPSTAPVSLRGWQLHDEGPNHTYDFPSVTLEPGATIRVLSGGTVPMGTDLFWKDQHVWNNDGDIAVLIDPSGETIDQQPCRT